MAYDSGLVERVADTLSQIGERGVRQKNVFGGRGFLAGKSTFVIVWDDEYPGLLERPGIEPFAPGGEAPMGTWVVVPADTVADDPDLAEWVRRGLKGIRR